MDQQIESDRLLRAAQIASSGGLSPALSSGKLAPKADLTLSEAIVLGLIRQNVTRFLGVFGHGSTEIANVLRSYESVGLVKTFALHHETAAVHAAAALRWVTGEKAAVITSIGPGALQALAGSLVPASDGLGVWFILGDETTEDEGPNMQQIPGNEQDRFLRLFSAMGATYKLHTPLALSTALRRGLVATEHPYRPGPFFLLAPMNTQPVLLEDYNLQELPETAALRPGLSCEADAIAAASRAISTSKRVVVKIGGGAVGAGPQIEDFLEAADGVAVTSPIASGVIPFTHPRNMTVGGSKGSISGNFAMEGADLLVAVGSRFVCQSDCSRTGYPHVKQVININADVDAAMHYGRAIPLVGDAAATLAALTRQLQAANRVRDRSPSPWFLACRRKRQEWDAYRQKRYDTPCLPDETWGRPVLTQPAAIKTATDWARSNDVISFFDAGDVQANGFQIVEDDRPGRTYTETGASYMGFAASAILATALSKKPFYALALSGDGSFVMNPQILHDGIAHAATGCILLLDNRSMAAISGLQTAQYGAPYATSDSVRVDYLAWAAAFEGVLAIDGGFSTGSLTTALEQARSHNGLSLIYVRVYSGSDPLGGMGVFGRWNVGPWCASTQALRHDMGL